MSTIENAFTAIALLAICALLSACDDDERTIIAGPPTATPTATAAPTATPAVMVVPLSGAQQVPPVSTVGTGTAEIVIDELAEEIVVDVSIEGIDPGDILFAHFHLAPAGESGGIVANLITSSPGASTFSAVVTAEDVIPLANVETFDDLVAAILDGRTYINIHTRANPLGELRGQTG